MKILMSAPGICACKELKSSAKYSFKAFVLGECENLKKIPSYIKFELQTRTNAILHNALLKCEALNAIVESGGKIASIIGTTTTGIEENYKGLLQNQDGYVEGRNALANPSLFVRDLYHLDFLAFGTSSACTSANKALMDGARLLKAKICDFVICGGVDSLNTLTINGFNALDILSQNKTLPFSSNRTGINIGEGAAVFVLTSDFVLEKFSEYKKFFNIEFKGYASNNDAFHITKPASNSMQQERLIERVLEITNIKNSEIDYINLHGTGTIENDAMEARLIAKFFKNTKASSTKPIFGHTLGASGALELGICANLILDSKKSQKVSLPAHIYDDNYDKNLPKINLVKKGDLGVVRNALNLSFAFGGDNCAMIIGKYDEY